MKKVLNWLIDKWLGGFLTAVFIFIITKYYELPEESRSNFFNFKWIIDILNIRIPLWTVFIIVICLIIITHFEKSILNSKFNSDVDDKSDVDDNLKIPINYNENYRSDMFGVSNTKWTWNYKWRSNYKKFELINLKPSCPDCDTPMDTNLGDPYSIDSAYCHKCRLEGKHSYFEIKDNILNIEKEIIRRIVNKETGT